ncbi:UDP-N-acetylmuramoyl-tripeptide--D-alanyl-D-alanine ligase [Adlercreutzia murintestinalis]|uniref:UDP-N-acetylmuramoyl-tripeptide--D-alanyl-D- alanine ligase n=1 Tax=Adlercreutzia murintestinalis TaxID=2941325 RepID=UPI00203D11E7|nr:UDP-N-acetylmuramoyl-tripeptide--D-alanyl-D-alanine ligase [Adlercreutzia murintestinalis]
MRLNVKQILQYTGGEYLIEPIDASMLLCGITWDSRDVQPGWLYVALPGERVDGHQFVEAALRAGAGAALVTECPDAKACVLARELGAGIICVPNTAHALSDLAREWRRHLKGLVVGLTGSTGKTTTKNLTRDVCAAAFSTVATAANQNNELGVPKTLLNADPETQVVIVEMGMRGLGQIRQLADVVRPDWGVVTNCGESHIELLGSRQNIAQAKSELFDALPAGVGRAFVNANDEFAAYVTDAGGVVRNKLTCVAFDGYADARAVADEKGLAAGPRVWAEDVHLDASGCARFTLCASGFVDSDADPRQPTLFTLDPDVERCPCALSLMGLHNVSNACAAAAVGRSLGMALPAIAAALAESLPEPGRAEVHRGRDGFMVIDDAYNANPDSMRASLRAFGAMEVSGRRIAVLGDMGELGAYAQECHTRVGEAVAGQPIDLLICIGELSCHIARGAQAAGMPAEHIVEAPTQAAALAQLEEMLGADDAVLVKASHFMGLDRLVEGLIS